MLSKIDIEKYIGKGIYIVPFTRDNIKENSINLKLSDKAWTLNPSKNGTRQYNHASLACNKNIITLVPHTTTVVYTEEVIALNSKFGGTFHAKVGVVAKGIVFSSTMIGPLYCGHLMVLLQNPTDNPISLNVGDTFISLALYKLRTKLRHETVNSNSGGHVEKLADLGIRPGNGIMKWLDEDWKKDIVKIKEKFAQESEYQEIKRKQNQKKLIIARAIVMALAIGFLVYIIMCKFYSRQNIIAKLVSFTSSIVAFVSTILFEKIFDQIFSRLFNK